MGSSFVLEGSYIDDKLDSSKPADSSLRIMSCNILAEFPSWTTDKTVHPYLPVAIRKEILFSAIDYYQPTVIGLQEFTTSWYNAMNDYADIDKWEIIKYKNAQRSDGELVFSTVMFRKDLYTLVESGTKHYSKHNNARCRMYTWVVLKDNATGKEFTVVSTHWDGGSSIPNTLVQVAELTEFVNKMKSRGPVFTTGDFNRNEITEEYKKYLSDADIYDAKLHTQKKVNDVGSWHNFCKNDFSWGSCDHITATKDTTIQKYQTITGNETIYASDHCWIIADIKFN
jgi:endonuclease/exonuclease/phosphatase family metal-dependent hydrolase